MKTFFIFLSVGTSRDVLLKAMTLKKIKTMTGILIVRSALNYDEKERKKKNFDSFSVSFFLSYFIDLNLNCYNKMLNEF